MLEFFLLIYICQHNDLNMGAEPALEAHVYQTYLTQRTVNTDDTQPIENYVTLLRL